MTGKAPAVDELGMVAYNYGGEALHAIFGSHTCNCTCLYRMCVVCRRFRCQAPDANVNSKIRPPVPKG